MNFSPHFFLNGKCEYVTLHKFFSLKLTSFFWLTVIRFFLSNEPIKIRKPLHFHYGLYKQKG